MEDRSSLLGMWLIQERGDPPYWTRSNVLADYFGRAGFTVYWVMIR